MVATRCIELMNNPDFNHDELVAVLSTDPGIAADILRIANSSIFGVTREIGSLKQAAVLLGMKRVRDLVMVRYLAQQIDRDEHELIDISYFWRRSLTAGIVASKLANAVAPMERNEAFVAGLLADIGVVILARALPAQYSPVAREYRPHGSADWAQAEYNLMGVSHGEVGAVVFEHWKLPEIIVNAVRHHHTAESDASGGGSALSRVVGAADVIAKYLNETTVGEAAATDCIKALELAGTGIPFLVEALNGIEKNIDQLASHFGVDVLHSKVFGVISKQLIDYVSAGCG